MRVLTRPSERLARFIDRVTQFDEAVDKWADSVRGPRLDPVFYGLSSAADARSATSWEHHRRAIGETRRRRATARTPRAPPRHRPAKGETPPRRAPAPRPVAAAWWRSTRF